jgi:exoribonuclease II
LFILFDEAGKLLAGRVMSETDSSAQVELESGKRVKVKAANVLMRFDKPEPSQLLPKGNALAAEVDLDLAWEFAPDDEFGFAELAGVYFQDPPLLEQQLAALLTLSQAPHYFRKAGKGRYKKAPAEVVQQALAAIEKKKAMQAQIDAWTQELLDGRCPGPITQQLYRILFKPDKNAPEYKAVVHAARAAQLGPLALLQQAGALSNAYEFHWQRFAFEYFPKGTGFATLQAPPITEDLPLSKVQAFSIDDSSTTEIDDALSVTGLGTGQVTVGIHIAAPGLVIQPDSPIDKVARDRLSTVYMPGHKITMLPDEVVQVYTLEAGDARPALSLYLTLDEASLETLSSETRIEQVPIVHNLRHDVLDAAISEAWLTDATAAPAAELPNAVVQLRPELSLLYRLAVASKARREVVRGKPETFNRPDYTFKLEGVHGDAPTGDERVLIGTRRRGAPLDLMVAEAMILANSTWGQMLANCGVPGIYRSQASLAPGVKVRMGAKALPHAGIGVPCYAWSTSPLRRYTDLVNQWQIMACVRHGATAALVAPFKPKDAQLFGVISAFDAAYTAYNQFQNGLERYWTLRYVQQEQITEVTATLIKDGLVRADTLPLVLPVMGADGLERGAAVRVKLGQADLMTLDISGTVLERLDNSTQAETNDEDADDELPATSVTLAIDLQDDANETPPNEPTAS